MSTALTIRDRLKSESLLQELGKVLPSHCKPERMARVALTAITRTPALADCDQASFFKCLMDLSAWGLECDGRRAHLIPFRNNKRNCTEVQLIIDYKGLVELAYRSGAVKRIHADVVRRGDLFTYNMGQVESHVPWFLRTDGDKPKEAGEVYAVYCIVKLEGTDDPKCEVLSRDEIEGVRKRSRAGGSGPWVTDWNEMAKKTAFRRCSKWLPLSAEIADAFDRDDDSPHPMANGNGKHVSVNEDFAKLLEGNGEARDDSPPIDVDAGDPQDDTAQAPATFDFAAFNAAIAKTKTQADCDALSYAALIDSVYGQANDKDEAFVRKSCEARKQDIQPRGEAAKQKTLA